MIIKHRYIRIECGQTIVSVNTAINHRSSATPEREKRDLSDLNTCVVHIP